MCIMFFHQKSTTENTMKSFFSTIIAMFFLFFCLIGCKKKEVEIENSIGETNSVIVVIDDWLWKGEVGDSIRKKLTPAIEGLLEEEALFNLLQHTEKNGDDDFCKNRNIIIVEKSINNFFEVRYNDFALNQNVIYLSGKNTSDILSLLEKNTDSIISTIQSLEIIETQNRIALNSLDFEKIKERFGISITIPSSFEYVSEENNFLWLKKENLSGNSSLLVYQTKIPQYSSETEIINKIIETRDSIGKLYIHSQEDENNCYMITEKAYTPYFKNTWIDNKKTFETKGTWIIKGVYMSGPFINYTIYDTQNNQALVLEGFIYAPSTSKRNTIHELEAIIKSVKFDQ